MPALQTNVETPADAALEPLGGATDKPLPPAARRALEEAQARRLSKATADLSGEGDAAEAGGPSGLEPTRYGDWERKGLAIDF